jgi:rubrerythrin
MGRLIDEDSAIDKITKRLFETAFNNVGIKQNIDETLVDVAENRLENWFNELPSVQPERLKGKWIHQAKFSRVECDQCGKVFRNTFAPKNFCPNCGADMRGEQDENHNIHLR